MKINFEKTKLKAMKQSIKLAGLIILITIALSILLSSCSDGDDPLLARVEIKMKATSSSSTIQKSARTAGSELIFREVLLGVTELEFEKLDDDDDDDDENDSSDDDEGEDDDGDRDDDDDEIEFEGNFVVDLI